MAADSADDDASAYLEAAGLDFEPPPDYEAPEPSTAALQELLEIVDERQKSIAAAPTGAAQSSPESADDALLRVYADAPCTTLLVAFAALGGGDAGVSRHRRRTSVRFCPSCSQGWIGGWIGRCKQ